MINKTNLDTENFPDVLLRVYTSILSKSLTFSFEREITFLGEFESQEVDEDYKNMIRTSGSTGRLSQTVNFKH